VVSKRPVPRRTPEKLHANARLSLIRWRELIDDVFGARALTEAAMAAGVSARNAAKWVALPRGGEVGLLDRSSAPRRAPQRTREDRVQACAAAARMTGFDLRPTLTGRPGLRPDLVISAPGFRPVRNKALQMTWAACSLLQKKPAGLQAPYRPMYSLADSVSQSGRSDLNRRSATSRTRGALPCASFRTIVSAPNSRGSRT
jgi:hypothetical protein